MGQGITMNQGITIGLDVCDRFTEAYVIDGEGKWIESFRVPTTREGLATGLSRYAGARVVLEVGAHSPWMSRQLKEQGFEVIVANPRRVRLIAESDSKNDRFDAEHLARLGRLGQHVPVGPLRRVLSGGARIQEAASAAKRRIGWPLRYRPSWKIN